MRSVVLLLMSSLIIVMAGCAKANDPVNPSNNGVEYVMTIPAVGDPLDIEISDNLLFAAEDQAGFEVLNKTTGARIAWQQTANFGTYLKETRLVRYQKDSKLLFIFDRDAQDYIGYFDMTDPATPIYKDKVQGGTNYITDFQFLPYNSTDQTFSFYRTCNTDGSYRSIRCDFDPAQIPASNDNADYTITYPFTCGKFDYDHSNNKMYVGARQYGLYCYNTISKTLVESFNSDGEVMDVKVQSGYAYLADRQGGFKIVNISDSTNFNLVYTYNTPSFATNVSVNSNYAAVSAGTNGVYIFNISNPANASFKAHLTFEEVGYVNTILFDGNTLYVASRDKGILKYSVN